MFSHSRTHAEQAAAVYNKPFLWHRDERERAGRNHFSNRNVVCVYIPLPGESHMIKPTIDEEETDNPLTGKGE